MRIECTQNEIAHLIRTAPLNYPLIFEYVTGVLMTNVDSWEHKELMRLRKEPKDSTNGKNAADLIVS